MIDSIYHRKNYMYSVNYSESNSTAVEILLYEKNMCLAHFRCAFSSSNEQKFYCSSHFFFNACYHTILISQFNFRIQDAHICLGLCHFDNCMHCYINSC